MVGIGSTSVKRCSSVRSPRNSMLTVVPFTENAYLYNVSAGRSVEGSKRHCCAQGHSQTSKQQLPRAYCALRQPPRYD